MSPGTGGGGGAGTVAATSTTRARRRDDGVVSLEWVLTLPLLVLAAVGLLEIAGVMRDALLVHEAARAGARAASTSTGTAPVTDAVDAAVGDLDPEVTVTPRARAAGELVEVTVTVQRQVGPVRHPLRARAVARVEPVVVPAPPADPP